MIFLVKQSLISLLFYCLEWGHIPALALNSISASVWNAGLNAGLALLPPFHFSSAGVQTLYQSS